jgi:8-amino-7-oxononanoate synthase
LLQLIAHFQQRVAEQGLQLMPSNTAIQPLLVGESERTMQISEALAQSGFLIAAIRPPTVPVNSARLRVTLTAAHTRSQVDRLVEALAEVMADEIAARDAEDTQ